MTNEILETDIELARGMLRKGAAANEVSSILVRRGLDPERATQLVSDLQQGKQVHVDLPFRPPRRRSGSTATPQAHAASSLDTPPRESSTATRDRGRSKKQPSPFSPANPLFSVGVAVAGVVLITAVILYNRHARKQRMQFDSRAESIQAAVSGKEQKGSESPPVVFELDKQGLRLAGHTLTRATIVRELTKVFGPPTRTNQVDTANRNVYAYDRQGVLVYIDKNGNAEMLVLDFSGLDGVIGASSPCRGELIVAGHPIAARSTVADLSAIPELSIPQGKEGVGVLGTTYLNFDLVFSYFANPRQLSLLEIDFR